MMEEADEHPEVLQAEDPNIASQLQEAAQTNVTAGNGASPKVPSQVSPTLMQAPSPLPANLIMPTGAAAISATLPTTTVPSSFPAKPTSSPKTSMSSALRQSAVPSSVTTSTFTSPVLPTPVTSPPKTTQFSAPGPVEIPHEASSSVLVPPSLGESPEAGGLIGWGKGIVHKVVEKTKSSVETVITTLDPGMKELILSGGDIDVVVTSTKDCKVSPVREAFQQVFGKATITGQESQANTAAQPVGFTAGLKGAEERIENLRHSGAIHEKQPVLSIEGFIAELLPDRWYELSCIVLIDPGNKITLETFSQPTLVPAPIVQRMQDGTPSDYPLRWSGLAFTVGQAVEEAYPNVTRSEWQESLTGVQRRETLFLAIKGLAEMYRQRLPPVESS